jgi:hypothetical protein
LVDELANSAVRFQDRVAMVHGAGQIRVRERNPPEWGAAQNFARRGLPVAPEEKSRLRIQVGVAPSDSG